MRFLMALVLIVAVVLGLGFYRGWFRASSSTADGKADVTLTVDKDKVKDDTRDAKEKVQGARDSAEATVASDKK